MTEIDPSQDKASQYGVEGDEDEDNEIDASFISRNTNTKPIFSRKGGRDIPIRGAPNLEGEESDSESEDGDLRTATAHSSKQSNKHVAANSVTDKHARQTTQMRASKLNKDL